MPVLAASQPAPDSRTRVMIVDDSAVIRSIVGRILGEDAGVVIVATAANGEAALQLFPRARPDVVILDIEMPVMDGLTALPMLLDRDPGVKVIVASTLSQRNADISMKALALGAADYIPKPSSPKELSGEGGFRRELLAKVRTLGIRARTRPGRPDSAAAAPTVAHAAKRAPTILRKPGLVRPSVIAIGCSTGGPQALFTLFRDMPPTVTVPIVVTQHMPPTFTAALAQHIQRISGRPAKEAGDHEPLAAGSVYVAPGDHHLVLDGASHRLVARLTQDPPENFCRPSVDPMLRSLARIAGAGTLVVMLTGMGSDGLAGASAIVEAGGTVIAQDEATSVVWGMPGAVAGAGLCAAVLPLAEIGTWMGRACAGTIT